MLSTKFTSFTTFPVRDQVLGPWRILLVFVALLIIVSIADAQDYLTASGAPSFAAPEPVELGFTDAANGNLHSEIPLASFPQRGSAQPLVVNFVYDSNLTWSVYCVLTCSWVAQSGVTPAWRTTISGGTQTVAYLLTSCQYSSRDGSGTTRFFPLNGTDPNTGATCTGSGYASDSSGYRLLSNAALYAPDGTFVGSFRYNCPNNPNAFCAVDSNGNYVGTQDTLGRTILTNNCGSPCQYSVPNSQGGTSNYTVATTNVNVNTNFLQPNVAEYVGTTKVVQSLTLPDGSVYSFKYDCDLTISGQAQVCSSAGGQSAYYGLLTQVTLPTGGTVNYSWITFSDSYANKARWLSSRQSAGGFWTYTPQVISTCSLTQVGCQQKMTVTKPSGAQTVYTFRLNNGAWPELIQYYDGSGSLQSTLTNTYDFSQPCVFSGCIGAAYIRLLNSKTTVTLAGGGSLSRQTAYGYDSPQTGNVTAVKDWQFYSGSSPAFPSVPDRATYTTYLTTGTNNINRPLSVTLCNNSGSDAGNCPGGGSRISQSLYTYDAYSSCASGLTSIMGVVSHDDTNFGIAYTQRGNATRMQRWVSGSTYLAETFCYDTTGQVLQHVDPAGTITSFSYSDNFFNETGAASMSPYAPIAPTNAYPKTITSGGLTTTFGYYFGSGKRAFSTDPNNVTTSNFFWDSLDRSTQTVYPIGWSLTNYTSTTRMDAYVPVADSSASSSCASCRHNQINFDSWGRRTNQQVVNAPGGAVNVDTLYDVQGRVQGVTHPYISASDPTYVFETFTYDGLDRQIQINHPDNQYVQVAYGLSVGSAGGIPAQLGSPTTYGYGYPIVTVDETGKQIERWVDGLGRTIEVDEPGAPPSTSQPIATPGTGNGTVTGSEGYSGPLAATPGTGSAAISGSDAHVTIYPSGCHTSQCAQTKYNAGTWSLIVNGFTATATYGQNTTPSSLANGLASAFNTNSSSPITATVGCGSPNCTLYLTTKAVGAGTGYTVTKACTWNDHTNFSGCSFGVSPTSPMTSGNAAQPAVYDSGSVSINVGGFQVSSNYQQGSTSASLATSLANGINASSSSPVNATVSGSVITLTAKQAGANTNYLISSVSTTSLPTRFPSPSFIVAMSGSQMTGGADAVPATIASPVGTFYTYDAADRLIKVSQGLQTRTFSYDGVGRVTSRTTPEAGTDSYYYTKSDNVTLCAGSPKVVCRRTDARGITITYTYDSLSRQTGKSYSNGQGAVTFQYDQGGAAAFALGRLTTLTDSSGSEAYTYNQMGWITKVQKTIGTTTFTTQYQFNTGGQLTQITYPSNRVVQQNLDSVGLLNTIVSGGTTYASIPEPPTGYDAAGHLLTFTYANGVNASFAYSPARGQMTSVSYIKGAQMLFGLNYGYVQGQANCDSTTSFGNNGTIQCIRDIVDNGRSAVYTYDFLGRLSTAVTTGSTGYGKWGLSWVYDRYSNRWSQNQTFGSPPSNSLSFATTPAPPTTPPGGAYTNRPDGYSFDASGNMLNDGANTLAYDAENCLTNAGATTYKCDAGGIRVKKTVSGGVSTVYIFSGGKDVAEYDYSSGNPSPGSPSREYIYLGERLIATIQGTSAVYHHADHLSVRMTTDATGQKIGEQGHYPFGETWYAANQTTKFIFTGYERDATSQNDYAMARFYVNRFGRFSCADPVMGNASDPQSWNRYAYVRNNPINITDPSGQNWFFKVFGAVVAFFGVLSGDPGLVKAGTMIAGESWAMPNIPGVRTPPTFPTGAPTVPSGDLSRFSTPPFLEPGSAYIDPATGSSQSGTNNSQNDSYQKILEILRSDLYTKLLSDPKCLSFLGSKGAMVLNVLSTVPIHLSTERKSTAWTSYSVSPESRLPINPEIFFNPKGQAFVPGDKDFFGMFPGSSQIRAQSFLHELGHATGVLRRDSKNVWANLANDADILTNCKKTVESFNNF